jgi:hypothetical protein
MKPRLASLLIILTSALAQLVAAFGDDWRATLKA